MKKLLITSFYRTIAGIGLPGMLRILPAFSFLLVAGTFSMLMITSCTGEQADDCFTNSGQQVTESRPAGIIEKIELWDNVNLVLIPGTTPQISVEAGENIMDAVTTEITNGTLVIRNTMKCNWVRNFNKELTVYATAPLLSEIRYEGSGDISTRSQLSLDSLQVSIWGGAGSFNLDLDAIRLNLAQHYGTVDLHVKGRAYITTIFSNSFGPFYCDSLVSNIIYIRNSGTNNCYVHPLHVLEAEITSVGNIYYSGNPYDVKSVITGSGKLVKTE
ncbi:MAG: lipoprotein [Bacteroidetes bacterium]|nr:MAG: lipoprotein [Bacteroidota bacterium]